VRTMGVERTDWPSAEVDGGALLRGVGELLRLVGAGEDGGLDEGWSGVGVGVGVGCGVDAGGRGEDAGGAGDDWGGEDVLPVPLACRRLWPWSRYSSTPSRSPRLKADDRATRAKRANSHEARSMLCVVVVFG